MTVVVEPRIAADAHAVISLDPLEQRCDRSLVAAGVDRCRDEWLGRSKPRKNRVELAGENLGYPRQNEHVAHDQDGPASHALADEELGALRYVRHAEMSLSRRSPEVIADPAFQLGVPSERHSETARDGRHGDVVVGGTDPSAREDELVLGAHGVEVASDRRHVVPANHDALKPDARAKEGASQTLHVGIGHLSGEDLIAHHEGCSATHHGRNLHCARTEVAHEDGNRNAIATQSTSLDATRVVSLSMTKLSRSFGAPSAAPVLVAAIACTRPGPTTMGARAPTPGRDEPASADFSRPEAVSVRFETLDGVTVHGTLSPASDGTAPAVVLVHQLGSHRDEWRPLVDALRRSDDLTTLAIDLRGHGESVVGQGGALDFSRFDSEAWARTELDVAAAVRYLREQAPVHPRKIALVGSSIGATAVVRAAAEDRALDVLVLLSPGRAYRGVDAITPALHFGPRALLAFAAEGEEDCVQTAQALSRLSQGSVEIVPGAAHGVALLDDARTARIVAFLREALADDAPRTTSTGEGAR